jgi:hypothetical protein
VNDFFENELQKTMTDDSNLQATETGMEMIRKIKVGCAMVQVAGHWPLNGEA